MYLIKCVSILLLNQYVWNKWIHLAFSDGWYYLVTHGSAFHLIELKCLLTIISKRNLTYLLVLKETCPLVLNKNFLYSSYQELIVVVSLEVGLAAIGNFELVSLKGGLAVASVDNELVVMEVGPWNLMYWELVVVTEIRAYHLQLIAALTCKYQNYTNYIPEC